MLRHVKLFESFIGEAKKQKEAEKKETAEIVGPTTVEIPKEIKEQIELAFELHKKLDAIETEYKKKLKEIEPVLEKYDESIMKTMADLKASQIKAGKILTVLNKQEGKKTISYKDMVAEALKKFNEATRKTFLDLIEKNKKKNPDKYWLTFEETVDEGLKDILKKGIEKGSELWNKLTDWTKNVWNDLKKSIDNYVDEVDALAEVAEKVIGRPIAV